MDADHANGDRGRVRIAALWRLLSWWERVVYAMAALLFLLALLVTALAEHLPSGWPEAMRMTLNTRLPDLEVLLLTACFPFLVATCCLALRRWSPETWRDFRRYWSMRAVLVGSSVLFGLAGWSSAVGLATPLDRIPPNLPVFLAVPAIAAAGLLLAGAVLAVPEFMVRAARAKQRQR